MIKFNFIWKSLVFVIALSFLSILLLSCSATSNFANEDLDKVVEPLTADGFMSFMLDEGWEVMADPIKEQLVVASAYASYDGMKIEFYELKSVNDARIEFIDTKEAMLSKKGSSYSVKTFEWKNGERITINSNSRYVLMSRVDDTLIYLDVESGDKDEVVTIVRSLGY